MTIRLIIILLPHSPSIEGGAPPREGVHPVPQGDPEALTLERRVGPGRVDPNHADEPGLDDPPGTDNRACPHATPGCLGPNLSHSIHEAVEIGRALRPGANHESPNPTERGEPLLDRAHRSRPGSRMIEPIVPFVRLPRLPVVLTMYPTSALVDRLAPGPNGDLIVVLLGLASALKLAKRLLHLEGPLVIRDERLPC